ncbi:MAG: GNAT family N-acetyltransferase [Elusimicrobia bacterium]|nr:GNAT family N-acetyltransferase [Elusimicrobiota bacterium]
MKDKMKSAEEAVKRVQSGQHVFVGSGASEPQRLVEALAARREELYDVELLHLLTLGTAPYAGPEFAGHLRHNALFIGPNVRGAVGAGLADYTPCYLSEIPSMIRSGRLRVDTALIQVAPPDGSSCSLGVSVDIVKAAVETAEYVVAQINRRMPATRGDSHVPLSRIDAFVEADQDLPTLPIQAPSTAATRIGRYVAQLVEDGSTIQAGIGSVPNAVLAALTDKKDLGVHSELVSDGVLSLIASRAVTGRRKTTNPGRVVSSFCLGSARLYEAVGQLREFEFYPTDYVNDPCVIQSNDRMVAINSALSVDLTGQVAADSVRGSFYSGVGGQVDFIRGAARSKGGKAIIAMPSTARDGTSRIVACLPEGTGVVTTRADVDFVVTEFGIASLKGKTIRERTLALSAVAHPAYRQRLIDEAKSRGFLDPGHITPLPELPYPAELECRRRFGDCEVFFRPMKPSDERRLKDLFYSQSKETTLMRFGVPLRFLSEQQFQDMVSIDYKDSMAIAAFAPHKESLRMIGVGRYYVEPDGREAEAAITVHDDYQRRGIGTFLMDCLAWSARRRGLETLRCEVMTPNTRIHHMLKRCFTRFEETGAGPNGTRLFVRLDDWKGEANPALEAAVRTNRAA